MLKSLKQGKLAESLVMEKVSSCGYDCKQVDGMFQDYDISCKQKDGDFVFTIEIKYDMMSDDTGNLAVEFFNSKSNKPSGIMATKADLWCFVVGSKNEIWIARTVDIKAMMYKLTPIKIVTHGGDKNSSMMIYKKDDILTHMHRIDDKTIDETIGVICNLISK